MVDIHVLNKALHGVDPLSPFLNAHFSADSLGVPGNTSNQDITKFLFLIKINIK